MCKGGNAALKLAIMPPVNTEIPIPTVLNVNNMTVNGSNMSKKSAGKANSADSDQATHVNAV